MLLWTSAPAEHLVDLGRQLGTQNGGRRGRRRAGVIIPRTTYDQCAALPHIATSAIQPGDLLICDGGVMSPGTRAAATLSTRRRQA